MSYDDSYEIKAGLDYYVCIGIAIFMIVCSFITIGYGAFELVRYVVY